MKYETPKMEKIGLEMKDVITASSGVTKLPEDTLPFLPASVGNDM